MTTSLKPEVVEYRVGAGGLLDVADYDAARYAGPANEYRQAIMASAYKRLVGALPGKRVLDVGCGTGRGIVDFAREADLAVGIDASLDMLSFAARKASGRASCALAAAYAQQLPFADGMFDVVISLNFLHLFKVEAQRELIAEMKRMVRPGGVLVLEFDNALHGLVLGLYRRWAGRDLSFLLPDEIRYVIGDHCRVVRIYGAVFPFVWRVFYRWPQVFIPFEKIAYVAPFNRLARRIYYKLVRTGS